MQAHKSVCLSGWKWNFKWIWLPLVFVLVCTIKHLWNKLKMTVDTCKERQERVNYLCLLSSNSTAAALSRPVFCLIGCIAPFTGPYFSCYSLTPLITSINHSRSPLCSVHIELSQFSETNQLTLVHKATEPSMCSLSTWISITWKSGNPESDSISESLSIFFLSHACLKLNVLNRKDETWDNFKLGHNLNSLTNQAYYFYHFH